MPKSTSSNANQTTTKVQIPPLSPRPRPEQGQKNTSALQTAAIHSAFLSQRTATDFLSVYSGHTQFITRVHEIGLGIDGLDSARRNYIKQAAELNYHLQELGQHLPRGPYLDDIRRKIRAVDTLRDQTNEERRPQTPDRPTSHHERLERDKPLPPAASAAGPPQSKPMDGDHRPNTTKPTPPSNQRSSTLRGPATEAARRRHNPCRLCNRMGHLQTQCTSYYCFYCDTIAPGHFAKYCTRNPYPGVAVRYLPPGSLGVVNPTKQITADTSIGTTLSNTNPTIPTPPHTSNNTVKLSDGRVKSTTSHTQPTINIATGPTYRPVFVVRKPKPDNKENRDLGKLHQLTPSTNPATRGSLSSHRPSTPQPERPRSPTPYDGDNEFEHDDVALYNMTGEGHVKGMESY